jgi:hypothetical protein
MTTQAPSFIVFCLITIGLSECTNKAEVSTNIEVNKQNQTSSATSLNKKSDVTFNDTIWYNSQGEEIHQIDIHDLGAFFNGKIVSVVGKVFSQRSSGGFLIVDLNGSSPNELLKIIIAGKGKLSSIELEGKRIRVTGRVSISQQKAEMKLTDGKDNIEVLK